MPAADCRLLPHLRLALQPRHAWQAGPADVGVHQPGPVPFLHRSDARQEGLSPGQGPSGDLPCVSLPLAELLYQPVEMATAKLVRKR
jgi:hypothetical protein